MNWDRSALPALSKALKAIATVIDDREKAAPYGHDESDTEDFQPDLVVVPETTGQVSQIFRACQQHKVPFTPVAGRSGKSGGSLPLYGGVSVSFEKMNRIFAISREDLTAVVQPGVITGELMKAADEKNLFYPPDPNSWEWCTIGGNIAENAGGPRALKYGVTRDYVLGLEWVLPDGEVVRCGRQTIKGVAGYDLVGLFVGSEGTLGVATEITLQLIPKPKFVRTALVCFPSVHHAAKALTAVLASGVLPRTLELLDDLSVKAAASKGIVFPANTGAAVIVEVDGNHDEGLLSELVQVSELCDAHGATETVVAQDESQREKLWAARRVLSIALRAMKPAKISEDIAVPRSKIPEVIERLKAMGERLNLTVATYGHAGDGNLHANILYDGPSERQKVERAIEEMLKITVELGGTITGEHGVGYAKRDYLPLEQPPALIALQKRLKAALDPSGLLNPGKIFPVK